MNADLVSDRRPATSEGRPRLLLADDHALLLEGVRRLLEEDFEVVGTAADGRALVAAAEQLQPDVAVVDIGMPLLNGIEATRHIRRHSPGVKVVILSQHSGHVYVREALDAGASAYILKQYASGELVSAIRTVMKGQQYLSPPALQSRATLPKPDEGIAGYDRRLTTRQREVLQLVAEGKAAKEIAGILNISVKTVEFHKQSIMDELGVRTTAELTRYALAHGIVPS
jgi:DNA-binding NarL/FixJ family response regulator